MQYGPALHDKAVQQNDLTASDSLHANMQTGVPVSVHSMGSNDEEVSAALDLHSTIVNNLTARLSMHGRLLFGVEFTDPWEFVEAFQQ